MRGLVRSLIVSLWFMILTFPIMAIKVVPTDTGSFILWRWKNVFYLGIGIFFLSFVWRGFMVRKAMMTPEEADLVWLFDFFRDSQHRKNVFATIFIVTGMLPLIFSLVDGQGLQSFSSLPVTILLATGLLLGFLTLKGKQQILLHFFSRINNQVNDSGTTRNSIFIVIVGIMVALGVLLNSYQLSVISSTLIWVMLGLGLNIIVGQAGMLVLGYVAFYAVGAYTYAVGNTYFGGSFVGFWIFLPLGGLLAAFAGILLSLPILRLRGDYLAIVTLGFGEIVRVFLEAGSFSLAPIADLLTFITGWEMPGWMSFPISVGGPAGFSSIPAPGLLGMSLTLEQGAQLLYFVALIMTFITIFAVTRLRDSRLGRSWMALREDEIACEAMGINKVTTKLSAFALGACWAGFGGVLFAAQTSFINPSSFTFMESAIILSIVVLGGLGSIFGVILGACILLILPEYLRSFNEYRMLIFGASMVLMMVFRPQGLITPTRKKPVFDSISRVTGNGGKV